MFSLFLKAFSYPSCKSLINYTEKRSLNITLLACESFLKRSVERGNTNVIRFFFFYPFICFLFICQTSSAVHEKSGSSGAESLHKPHINFTAGVQQLKRLNKKFILINFEAFTLVPGHFHSIRW